MPRFRRFCAIFKYNEENTIEKIKQNLKIETKFIGIYKLNVFDEMNSHIRDEMYIYVQFDKCDLEKKRVEKDIRKKKKDSKKTNTRKNPPHPKHTTISTAARRPRSTPVVAPRNTSHALVHVRSLP